MSGPELSRRLDALKAFRVQINQRLKSTHAAWALAYVGWEQTKDQSAWDICVASEREVKNLETVRERTSASITQLERLVIFGKGKAGMKKRKGAA